MNEVKRAVLADIYGLFKTWELDKAGWTFKFSKTKRAIGDCHEGKKLIRLSEVVLPHLSEAEWKDTLRHEVAHALAGHHNGHNKIWKRYARLVGADPTRTKNLDTAPKYKYAIVCPKGKIRKGYYRRPSRKVFARVAHMWVTGEPETKGKLRIVSL